jgi:putative membrane protein insertion efficiency factor
LKGAALAAIRWYKRTISPTLPAGCRYQPTCSEYTYEAIEVHGLVKGIAMGIWRLARCNPFSKGGLDPVPMGSARKQESIGTREQLNTKQGNS